MKKQFTTALMMAAAITSAQAQVMKFDGSMTNIAKGEVCDSVNWYDDDVQGTIFTSFETAVDDDEATTGKALKIVTETTCNDWERCLKFDIADEKIKPNTIYRVKVRAKADILEAKDNNRVMQIMMLRGDEYCDMPWVTKSAEGSKTEFRYNVAELSDEYTTETRMFYYTSRELQEEFYGDYNKDQAMPNNQFLRLTFSGAGEYYVDQVLVEEAPIAGVTYCENFIKVDFGFPINNAALVKANGGTVLLDKSIATVTVDGEAVEVESVEVQSDGLFIFLGEDADLDESNKVVVSLNCAGTGLAYSGNATPGNGVEVVSFTGEEGQYDDDLYAESALAGGAKLVSSTPADGSFELDGSTLTYSFTFNKEVFVCGDNAPVATLYGNGKKYELKVKEQAEEIGTTAIFYLDVEDGWGFDELPKGAYYIEVDGVLDKNEEANESPIRIDFEVGKVKVADIEYTDVEAVTVLGGEGETLPDNWTAYWNGGTEVPGSSIRTFAFDANGKYTNGFYLSQRDADAGTSLSYGEQEGYPFVLPAGNVQVSILASAWQGNSGNFKYQLVDAATLDDIATGSAVAGVAVSNKGIAVNECGRIDIKLENFKGGKCILMLTTDQGGYGNAIIVFGIDVKTYAISAGETADGGVVVDGTFAGVSNDGVPAAGTGWHVYQDNNMLEPGSVAGQRTRFFTFSNIANMPVAFYNRNLGGAADSYRLTYGEQEHPDGTYCTDEDDEIKEPALALDEAKYNFSWYMCNWRGASNTYWFEILDEDGDVVYKREDICTTTIEGDKNVVVDGEKIEFSWRPEVAGKYTLKWYMTGESMVGNIKVEKMGSQAVFWHSQLNAAIASAQEELNIALGDIQYAGATRDALAAAINKAKTVEMHTGAEYTAMMDDLAQYVKDMKARRAALADYDKAYSDLASQLESMEGEKWEGLSSYVSGKAIVEKYYEVEGYTIPNDQLIPVVAEMKSAKDLNDNLMKIGVPAMTDQITRLASLYARFCDINETESDDDILIAADDALSDDQELVGKLKLLATSALYHAIANGYNFTKTVVEESEYDDDGNLIYEGETYEEAETVDLTGYIRNSVFYAFSPERELKNTEACNEAVPGWEFDAPNGLSLNWGWGGWEAPNAPVAPVNIVNQQLGTKWGTDFKVWQDLTDVPVGVYNIGSGVADDTNTKWEDGTLSYVDEEKGSVSYLYAICGEEEKTRFFDIEGQGQWRGIHDNFIEDFAITATEGVVTGDVTMGAVLDVDGSFAALDNAKLIMSAKAEGFDYAAAAAKLDKEIADGVKGIKEQVRNDAPVSTIYFNTAGQQTTAPKGLTIKVERWADGYTRVTKTIVK